MHDYIQWLFPLPERSGFNPAAPVLSRQDIGVFRGGPELQERLLNSFRMMLRFYGFRLEEGEPPAVVPSPDHEVRMAGWLSPGNHNFLRMTRILRSMTLLGRESEAQALLACLREIYESRGEEIIGPDTLRYWIGAANSAIPG
ncbi:MAG TPA: opioid growth factor receptor-related protein [Acetobacteraceae bacterium]|nr:opioid growth factor receptor-related protein [Acetobacteraceae bacterium]